MHHKSLLAFLLKKKNKPKLILLFSFLFKIVVLLLNSKTVIFSSTCRSMRQYEVLSMKK